MYYISHYRLSRHYGGPEEGGWWYDRSEFVKVEATAQTEETAFEIARTKNRQAKEEYRQPDEKARYQGRFSVAGHTDDVYRVETKPGTNHDIDQPRPHYE